METITYNLTRNEGEDIEIVLKNTCTEIIAKLKNEFGEAYEISFSDIEPPKEDWSHEIKIRKGAKIGARLDLKWKKESPAIVEMNVEESSKIGNILIYVVLIPISLICAYMGLNNIEPLAFLPGRKLAAALGGIVGLIPGGLLIYFFKSIFLKQEKKENDQLILDIRKVISMQIVA
ncbi:hypothetical protein LV716_06320 [Flagellimonas sp. HMM57]|uniref:hypothetical protein n=1 Tax=unclassified Flagellimonas TaxID=2644544 RepID=UPI0013D104D9|nr:MULTISPECIES: hypothetical protein [unclassified Flagellimonas]UII77383.1 hypothetical protein LV716_06320 [Flagellimonas sp. HMM57]